MSFPKAVRRAAAGVSVFGHLYKSAQAHWPHLRAARPGPRQASLGSPQSYAGPPPFHLSPTPGEKVRKNQNKATTVPVPPASAALPKYPKTLPPSLPLKLWPVWQVGRESYFTDGETEDQTGERPRPWHPQVRESGPEHRALPPPPELGTGRKLGIAQRPGWAGGVTALGSARKSLELGLQHRGGDVSHFPCDPRLQTKAGRELFL